MKLRYQFFADSDLTHITDDHFEIKLVAQLLDQIYVVPSPQSPLRYDDAPPDPTTFTQSVNSTGSPTASAPMMPLHVLINPTLYIYIVIRYVTFINVYFYVQYHQNNTLESRLYLFLQGMHELIQVNNGLY